MPLMIDDFVKGQKAGYEMDLLPLQAEADRERIQAERERIPLETEKMQQSLQTGKLEQQSAAFKLQSLLKEEEGDTKFKGAVEQLIKSGQFDIKIPISEQNSKLARLAFEQGNFRLGRQFQSDSEKALQHEEAADTNRTKVIERQTEMFGRGLQMLSPSGDNLESVLKAGLMQKVLTQPQYDGLLQQGRVAMAGGQEEYQQWKNKLGEQFKSFNQRQLDQKAIHDEAEIRRKNEKDRLDRIEEGYRLDRREAAARDRTNAREDALNARERERTEREEKDRKFREYNETRTRIIPSLNRAINAAEISLTNAPKDQKPAIEAEIKELKGQRTDAFEVINSLRKELKLPTIPEPKEKPDPDKPEKSEIKPIRVGGFEIAPAEPAKRVKGKTYKLPNGLYDWTGTGWVPSKEKEK
jgi:hypothetical protein